MTLPLEDGSRLTLNTDTRLRVRFDKGVRRIELDSGEALFEVAKDSHRAFVVQAGDREITALGTEFLVRYDETQTAVTLLEGKVRVDVANKAPTLLQPGERMTMAGQHAPIVDRPTIEIVTAWRKGEIVFENTPLRSAIEEMNRYSVHKLELGEGAPAEMPVSGLFRSGDAENFALALTSTHPLESVKRDGRIVIYRR
jgi:transmembrane sensor